jgi:PleD family two-component response regulator
MFSVVLEPPAPPDVLRGIVRARCGNALVNALRDIDLATALDHERFLVLMPLTERQAGGEVARRIIGAVASGDPVVAGGRTFPPKVIGGVVAAINGEPGFDALVADVTQLLEQAQVTGASLAVET